MTDGLDEKILDRIKKLHAKAVSAKEIGSEAEALTFMEAVQKMLDKYDLEMSEVEYQLSVRQDPVDVQYVGSEPFNDRPKKTRDAVQQLLAASICRLYHCEFLQNAGFDKRAFHIVGRKEHRAVAEFMCVTLIRTMEKLAYDNYVRAFYQAKAAGDVTQARGYREAYRQGFVTAVAGRIQSMLVDREVQAKGAGLVRINNEKKMVNDFLDHLSKTGGSTKMTVANVKDVWNGQGLRDGHKKGETVDLGGTAVKGSTATLKRLGAGNG